MTTAMNQARGLALVALISGAVACSRSSTNSASQPPASPSAPGREANAGAPGPSAPSGAPGSGAAPSAPAAGPAASGPRAQISGEHYTLNVELSAPPSTPGESTLSVEVRGANGFHVNERAPLGLDLEATNATTRAQVRAPDATQRTQEIAAFRVPVQVTGAGATVRGTARAVVCRTGEEGICEFVTRQFAVALP